MAETISLLVYPAEDLETAKKFYNTFLGVEPYADGEYYVGYKLGDFEVGLDPNGTHVIAYIHVEDIKASLKKYEAAGASHPQAGDRCGRRPLDCADQRTQWERVGSEAASRS